jgi:hypothetical protein
MKKILTAVSMLLSLTGASAIAHPPKTHRLEATPATVAYGYYWADAPPVLRIESGDIIDVDTLLTNTPTGLAKAGVADDKIQASLKTIVGEVIGDRRGPYPDGPGLCRGRRTRRCIGGQNSFDRVAARLRL